MIARQCRSMRLRSLGVVALPMPIRPSIRLKWLPPAYSVDMVAVDADDADDENCPLSPLGKEHIPYILLPNLIYPFFLQVGVSN